MAVAFLSGCGLRPVNGSATATASLATSGSRATPPSAVPLDEPSPPGGLGNVVESYSRNFGRPTAASAINQPSYAYGNWPVQGLFIQLDNDLRRAREVRINFGATRTLADARAQAQSYLPVDAKQISTFTEAGTGDPGVVYASERLAAVFPTSQPPGQFVVIYDGGPDHIAGLILRMGPPMQ